MLNPFLHDTVERVTRDTARKLGWDDRLIGTMRSVLENGVEPRGYAPGAAAAVAKMWPETLRESAEVQSVLQELWKGPKTGDKAIIASIVSELQTLHAWCKRGFQDLTLKVLWSLFQLEAQLVRALTKVGEPTLPARVPPFPCAHWLAEHLVAEYPGVERARPVPNEIAFSAT